MRRTVDVKRQSAVSTLTFLDAPIAPMTVRIGDVEVTVGPGDFDHVPTIEEMVAVFVERLSANGAHVSGAGTTVNVLKAWPRKTRAVKAKRKARKRANR